MRIKNIGEEVKKQPKKRQGQSTPDNNPKYKIHKIKEITDEKKQKKQRKPHKSTEPN